jgi:hypothetical protein
MWCVKGLKFRVSFVRLPCTQSDNDVVCQGMMVQGFFLSVLVYTYSDDTDNVVRSTGVT